MGAHTPSVPFERAEFVRADQNYSILNRIVKATQVDTILHTFMVTNSAGDQQPAPPRDQRDRDDEPSGRGRGLRILRPSHRREVLHARLRVLGP